MQEYDKNMHKYAIVKYAQICTNMQKICKKYAQICNNMQGLGTLQNRQKYANYMHKYAQICNICNQGFHMQNMREYAPPTSGKTTGWASRDIPGYPSTSFLKWDIPG